MAVHRLIDGIRLQMSTALHGAVEGGHLPTVQLLLDNGADKNSTREDDRSPLHRNARLGHGEAVQQPLDRGADMTSAGQSTATCHCSALPLVSSRSWRELPRDSAGEKRLIKPLTSNHQLTASREGLRDSPYGSTVMMQGQILALASR